MGISGCGKTTIGKLLSKKLNLPFYDADEFHSEINIEKMKNNKALNDTDRLPWLKSLSNYIKEWQSEGGAILACSALSEKHREILSSKVDKINWVYLYGSFEIITDRLEKRNSHFMKAALLKSQFEALEIPQYGLHISVEKPAKEIVSIITSKLNLNA